MLVVRQQRKTYDYALSRRAFGSGNDRTSCVGRLHYLVVLAESSPKRGSRIKRAALPMFWIIELLVFAGVFYLIVRS